MILVWGLRVDVQEKKNITSQCTHEISVTNQSQPPGGEKTIMDTEMAETNMERLQLPWQGPMLFLISAFLSSVVFFKILGTWKHGNTTPVTHMDHVTLEDTVILNGQEELITGALTVLSRSWWNAGLMGGKNNSVLSPVGFLYTLKLDMYVQVCVYV